VNPGGDPESARESLWLAESRDDSAKRVDQVSFGVEQPLVGLGGAVEPDVWLPASTWHLPLSWSQRSSVSVDVHPLHVPVVTQLGTREVGVGRPTKDERAQHAV